MNPHKHCSLSFPAVRVGQFAALIRVEATSYRLADDRWCSFGKQAGVYKNHLKSLLDSSRHQENPATRHLDIAIDFIGLNDRELDGRSYDLAVLLADKIARFHPAPETLLSLIATGKVEHDLRVTCVESFREKVAHIQTALQTGDISHNSLFCYPKANHIEAESQLKLLEQAGIQLRPVQYLHELEDVWIGKTQRQRHWWKNLFITVVLLLALLWVMAKTCLLPMTGCQLPMGECKQLSCTSDFIDPKAFKLHYRHSSKTANNPTTYPLHDQQVLHSGDQFKLYFQAPVDAYVYVYYLDSQENLRELLSELDIPHLVTRQTEYVLPNEQHSFTLRGNAGTEQLYFIASKIPETQLFGQYQQLIQAGNAQHAAPLKAQLLQSLQVHRSLTIQHQL